MDEEGICLVLVTSGYVESRASSSLPPTCAKVLEDFSNVLVDDFPPGLPPMRTIQHQIDLFPHASIPNKLKSS